MHPPHRSHAVPETTVATAKSVRWLPIAAMTRCTTVQEFCHEKCLNTAHMSSIITVRNYSDDDYFHFTDYALPSEVRPVHGDMAHPRPHPH